MTCKLKCPEIRLFSNYTEGKHLKFGPQGLQIFVERLVDLEKKNTVYLLIVTNEQVEKEKKRYMFYCTIVGFIGDMTDLSCIEWRLTCPLKQVLIDIPIISAKDRIQLLVIHIKGINQWYSIGPQLIQEHFNVSRNLHGLWHSQQSSLQKHNQGKNNQWTETVCKYWNKPGICRPSHNSKTQPGLSFHN